jgi:hypothetical protein
VIRVLLDEDLPIRLRYHLGEGVHAQTVEYRGWKGLENGELLDAIAAAGDVDVLVTADRRLPGQQNLSARPFAVAVLRPTRKRLPDLLELVPRLVRILPSLSPGQSVEIHPPDPPASPERGW